MLSTALICGAGAYIVGSALYTGSIVKNKFFDNGKLDDNTGIIANVSSTFRENFEHDRNSFLLSKNYKMNKKEAEGYVLIIAPVGAGKSRRIIMHNIDKLLDCSLVCTDPSGELEKECNPIKSIIRFNPLKPDQSIGFDPIRYCNSTLEVKQNIETILNNSTLAYDGKSDAKWIQLSIPLLKAFAIANYKTKKFNFAEFVKIITTYPITRKEAKMPYVLIDDSDNKKMKIAERVSVESLILESKSAEAIAEFNGFKAISNVNDTFGCIRGFLSSSLTIFLEENVVKLCDRPIFKFKELKEKEYCLYIQVPTKHSKHYSPITSVLMEMILNDLMDEEFLNNQGLQVNFILDEFANIGKISNIVEILTSIRKYSVSFICAIQNTNQLDKLYKEDSNALWQSFSTKCVMGGLLDDSSKISTLLGNYRTIEDGRSVEKSVISQSQIRLMKEDELLIIQNNKPARKDKMMEKFGVRA